MFIKCSYLGVLLCALVSLFSQKGWSAGPSDVTDPCPSVPRPGADESEEVKKAAMQEFGKCMREFLRPCDVLSEAIVYTKIFKTDPSIPVLSKLSDEELSEFMKLKKPEIEETDRWLGLSQSYEEKFRTSFSNEDLEEFLKLVNRRKHALMEVESKIFAAMDLRKELVLHYAGKLDRYAALLSLRETADDQFGFQTYRGLVEVFKKFKTDVNMHIVLARLSQQIPIFDLLHPYAIHAVIPSEGADFAPLDIQQENPFSRLVRIYGELGGPQVLVDRAIDNYKKIRSFGKPKMPEHPLPAQDAVRVAFIDSGIDYYRYPELGRFLGSGREGELASADLIDGGDNPWVPDLGEFSHGTKTVSSLVTVIKELAPELLEGQKLDLAVWKDWTYRGILSGLFQGSVDWNPRLSLQHGIINQILKEGVKPKIVSVSMSFNFQAALEKSNQLDMLKKSPWLWVMSAGNQGREVKQAERTHETTGASGCFSDVPGENRNGKNVLCVGALVRHSPEPEVADYSNYGDIVDVYAYESYDPLCPNGTSCATPAISAAAAMIAAKYPHLTPAQIKEVIVAASVEKQLKVHVDMSNPVMAAAVTEGLIRTERTVRVFDPIEMVGRAYEIAATQEMF